MTFVTESDDGINYAIPTLSNNGLIEIEITS
jgi:hypothetical protein